MLRIGYNIDMYLLNPYIYGGAAAFTNDYSLLFDGVDEYVNASAPTSLDSATTASVSFWMKKQDQDTYRVLGGYKDASNQFGFSTSLNTKKLFFVFSTTQYGLTGADIPTTGVWYHVVATYNGGGATNADRLKIYVNGSASTITFTGTMPTSLSATFSSGNWRIGERDLLGSPWLGNIDEVALFDYELTSGQVTSLYNSGTPTDLDNTSGVTAPVHWWRMGDGDTYPTITDVGTTGGVDGTMTNMEAGDIVTDTP
jgi:hypothetical protein